MSESSKAVSALVKIIYETSKKVVGEAAFDKTFFGIVTAINGNTYTVSVQGQTYNIKSGQSIALHERVAVTAPQGNFKNLIIHKI